MATVLSIFSDRDTIVELLHNLSKLRLAFMMFWDFHVIFHNVYGNFLFKPLLYSGSILSTFNASVSDFCLFDDSKSSWCEMLSHCGFDLHFPN